MVFTIPAESIAGEAYRDRIQYIYIPFKTTASDRSVTSGASGAVSVLPTGILQELCINFNAPNAPTVRKGQCFIDLFCLKHGGIGSTDQIKVELINDYVYSQNSPHWIGEVPVEDGDQLKMNVSNSYPGVLTILLSGYMVRIGVTRK